MGSSSKSDQSLVELRLQEFCEACLELLSGQAARESVLAEVLPSFARIFWGCGRVAGLLRKELSGWREKSQQLVRLATLHCGAGSTSLIESLEQISREATRAIEALGSLTSSPNDVVALNVTEEWSLSRDDIPVVGDSVDIPLKQFCEAVLTLLQAGPDKSSVIPQTMPSLYHLFSGCGSVALAQLRAELNVSRTTAEQLIQFADAHCTDAGFKLASRVGQAQDCADRLISAMESLADCAPDVDPDQNVELEHDARASDPGSVTSLPTDAERVEAQKYYRLAIQSHQRQDFRTAATLYSEALRFDSTLRLAWLQRGRIRLLKADASLAVADLTRSLQLLADDPLALRLRGDALTICGQHEEALQDYDRSLEILPESTAARYNRAVVLRLMGQLDRAWHEFEQLLRQRTNRPGAHLNRGLISLERQQVEQAIQEFRAALVAQPGLPEAIERLSQLGVTVDALPAVKERSHRQLQGDPRKPKSPGSRKRPKSGSSSAEISVPLPADEVVNNGSSEIDALDELAVAVLSEPVVITVSEPSSAAPTEVSSEAITDPVVPVEKSNSAADVAAVIASGGTPARSTSIEVRCPGCHGMNTIRWERLQPGKSMACRRCACHFTVQTDGTLVRMVKNRHGQWVEHRDRFALWKDRRVMATVASLLIVLTGIWFLPNSESNVIPEDPAYPKELEPRAKLFTLAWLKGDFRTMRQLTDAVQSRELHLWAMDNPAPVVASMATLERDATFKVEIVDADPPNARVQVKIDGLRVERGNLVPELAQHWRQEGNRWIFQPVAQSNL